MNAQSQLTQLSSLLRARDPNFWKELSTLTRASQDLSELLQLAHLRRQADQAQLKGRPLVPGKIKLAIIGGYSFFPLHAVIGHLLVEAGVQAEIYLGVFDNYVQEITEVESELYQFKPQAVFLVPSENRCRYEGQLLDAPQIQRSRAEETANEILNLCNTLSKRSSAEVIVANFQLPGRHDLGAYRAKTAGSDWTFRKLVNLELGLKLPHSVHLCDLEFLSARKGLLQTKDDRDWYETKQMGSPTFLVDVARELTHILMTTKAAPKKVAIFDLDNTLWGGDIGDDGLNQIELGDTSPRGEAFKAFQKYLLSLTQRGFLLAVCSKNDHKNAIEPFEKHPEMILKPEHISVFKANWNAKSDNIQEIAIELKLGLDSFVFIDDTAAEIEIVKRFVPEVATILLSPDPADFINQLQDSRFFEVTALTDEDRLRTAQYQQERKRKTSLASSVDMKSFLRSLNMVGSFKQSNSLDLVRITQLINKSNQFNLTSARKTMQEIETIASSKSQFCLSFRLEDQFGDLGLISAVILKIEKDTCSIDVWVMSCRVLKREVEGTVMNEIVRLAKQSHCKTIRGHFVASEKNAMVKNLYPALGFHTRSENEFELDVASYPLAKTEITIREETHDQK